MVKSIWTQRNPYTSWHPETQCFGTWATDELGENIRPQHPDAARWCALGWLHARHVPKALIVSFNRWCVEHYNNACVTVLNDINYFQPRDFAFAWDCFLEDFKARPDAYSDC